MKRYRDGRAAFFFLLALVAAALCASPGAADITTIDPDPAPEAREAESEALAPPLEAPGGRELMVHEPVFDGRAYVFEAGPAEAEAVLLVHGLGDEASTTWRHLAPELARSYHVIAPDLPGFGRSDKQNALYSPENYVAFLNWLARDRLGDESFYLVGHSLGGAVALKYAADHPRDVKRLTLISAAGILHRNAYTRHLAEFEAQGPVAGLLGPMFRKLNNLTRTLLMKFEFENLPDQLDLVLGNRFTRDKFLSGDPSRIAALALIEHDFSRELQNIKTPTHILWGAEDAVTPPRTAKLLRHSIERSELHMFSESGHTPMLTEPAAFNRTVRVALGNPPRSERDFQRSLVLPVPESERVARCENEDNAVYYGAYKRIDLVNCTARIEGATAANITIADSRVRIKNTRVNGKGVAVAVNGGSLDMVNCALDGNTAGLYAASTRVTATAARFHGETAVLTANSELDLAGCELKGRHHAVLEDSSREAAESGSKVLFSVSTRNNEPAHGMFKLPAGDTL